MYDENNRGYIWKVSIKNISLRLCSYVISKSISIHNIDHQCCVLGTFFLSNVMLYLSLSTYIWYIIISLDWWVLVIIVPAGLWSPRCVPASLPDKCAAPCLVVWLVVSVAGTGGARVHCWPLLTSARARSWHRWPINRPGHQLALPPPPHCLLLPVNRRQGLAGPQYFLPNIFTTPELHGIISWNVAAETDFYHQIYHPFFYLRRCTL